MQCYGSDGDASVAKRRGRYAEWHSNTVIPLIRCEDQCDPWSLYFWRISLFRSPPDRSECLTGRSVRQTKRCEVSLLWYDGRRDSSWAHFCPRVSYSSDISILLYDGRSSFGGIVCHPCEPYDCVMDATNLPHTHTHTHSHHYFSD